MIQILKKISPFRRNFFYLKSGCVKFWTFRMSDLKGKLFHRLRNWIRSKRGKNKFEFVSLFPVGHHPQTNMSLSPMTLSLYGQGSSPSLNPNMVKVYLAMLNYSHINPSQQYKKIGFFGNIIRFILAQEIDKALSWTHLFSIFFFSFLKWNAFTQTLKIVR